MTETKKISIDATREDAYNMYLCLKDLVKIKLDTYIKFDVGHNINRLKENYDLCEDIRNNKDDIDGFADYQKVVRDIMRAYTKNGKIEGQENIVKYEQELLEAREKYSDVVSELEKRKAEFEKAIKSTITILELIVLPLKKFPKEIEIDFTPILGLIER